MANKKIVTIGGGSGQFVLLSGLRDYRDLDITAIVSMVDSGGSTGRLRDEFGILPPGDIMKCVLALSPYRDLARSLLLKRFEGNNRLKGHSVGNMLLTILSQYAGNFPDGVDALAEALGVKGKIYPVTVDKATLVAELADGTRIYGEKAIDVPAEGRRQKIKDAYLVPHHSEYIKVYPPVIKAIKEAKYVVFGPGDLFTSIIPNLLVPGVKEAIVKSKAKLVYISNIMTKHGETDNYNALDFVEKLEEFAGRKVNIVIYNKERPSAKALKEYQRQQAWFVECPSDMKGRTVMKENIMEEKNYIVRHNHEALAKILHRKILK